METRRFMLRSGFALFMLMIAGFLMHMAYPDYLNDPVWMIESTFVLMLALFLVIIGDTK